MRILLMLTFLLGTLLVSVPAGAQAQGLGSLVPGVRSAAAPADPPADPATGVQPAPGADAIAGIVAEAAKSGLGVIVIDATGQIVAQPGQPDAPVAEGAAPEHSDLMHMQDRALRFRAALLDRLLHLPDAFNEVLYILRAASPDGSLWTYGKILLICLVLFAIGVAAEREIYGKRLMKRFVTAQIRTDPQGYIEKMPFLVIRFIAGVGGILVSMAVAYVLGFAVFGTLDDTALQFTVTLINIGYFACRFAAGLWRMILSPFLTQYRIPTLSDRDAKRLHRWLWMLATLDICAILFGMWIGELGLNYDAYAFIASVLSALVVCINIAMVLVNRSAVSRALRHGKPIEECSLITRILSRVWAPGVIFYVLFAWVELTYDLVLANPSSIPLIAGAYGIVISIIVVYGVINYLIERGFARARALRHINDLRQAEVDRAAEGPFAVPDEFAPPTLLEAEAIRISEAEETARALRLPRRSMTTFEELARRVAGILAFVAGAYAFFYIWDNDGAQMIESFADRLLDIMVIAFIGYVVYHAFRIWIDTKIADEIGELEEAEPGDEGGGSSASRLATLLPLFRNVVLIVVAVTVMLIVMMELGVNVGPLFAGAGIVGVAIGFGSQALVRDIFAGAFFLFDDAFRKGEYLDVGGVKGTVEKISVRSFQLRHHLGYLHTIPFGELQVMTNYSRDWVIMKLPLRVTYDTDVEHVRKLIKKLGQELLEEPEIGGNFIQPLKSQGVIEMQDSAMIIRVKFMTKPGDQWLVRKRVYEEIRALFEREGIRFAHREVTVRLADGKVSDLTEDQKKAVTAAAQATMDPDLTEEEAGGAEDDR